MSLSHRESICWICANAIVSSCHWIKQLDHVWEDAFVKQTCNGLRYVVIRCGNYVPEMQCITEVREDNKTYQITGG